ncbi:hypothetical protein CHLRE_13g579326v5 [Chlamydomonas reinhardtii]|uniref:Uncharacterized protein n=1 Tax=Chlamydomonas reinhardtii TaxID=3055 RepID=A0A2K3D084_CHLRE|nr:uncharacterized protein CHLRE_13g579326v5 [Chlamydomonas reinhardtii]PNW73948.1 hypothetical protein CHLRE_13g579326v5 [Chlamydomonas reinhardtii]
MTCRLREWSIHFRHLSKARHVGVNAPAWPTATEGRRCGIFHSSSQNLLGAGSVLTPVLTGWVCVFGLGGQSQPHKRGNRMARHTLGAHSDICPLDICTSH